MVKSFKKAMLLLCCIVLAVSVCLTGCDGVKTAESVYNVKSFGAKGDDKTNDADAINKAIDEAKDNGGVLYFPKGTYLIENNISFPVNVVLKFEKGAMLKPAEKKVITIRTRGIDAPNTQIFAGDGTYKGFEGIVTVYAEWFGAIPNDGEDDSAAIQKALESAKKLYLSEGEFTIGKSVLFDKVTALTSIDITGAGQDKTVLKIARNVLAFDYYDVPAVAPSVNIMGIAFVGADGSKTAEAVKIGGAKGGSNGFIYVGNCHFENLKHGVFFDYAGFCHFVNNTAINNTVVFEISEHSMFIYFDNCNGDKNGTFVKAIVAPSGGYSNGIQIKNSVFTNSTNSDIYITQNQAVFLENNKFTGGKGGEGAVYLEDVVDFRINNCEITSADGSRPGIALKNSHYGIARNNIIENCSNAIYLKQGNSRILFIDNELKNNKTNDVLARQSNDIKFVKNKFLSNVSKIIETAGTTNDYVISENEFAVEFDIQAAFNNAKNLVVEDNTFGGSGR